MTTLEIKHGFYWTAGYQFWKGSDYEIPGVGIDTRLLKENAHLEVIVNKNRYILDCYEAIDFARRFKSFGVRQRVKLAYVSKSLLQPFLEER